MEQQLVPVINDEQPVYWNKTATGIVFGEGFNPTYEDFESLALYAIYHGEAYKWLLVDVLVYANEYLGETAAQLEAILPYAEGTIQNYIWVGKNWPEHTRVEGVRVSFHQVVTPLVAKLNGNPDNRGIAQAWLRDARGLGWKRADLERSYRSAPMLPPSLNGGVVSLPVPEPDEPMEFVVHDRSESTFNEMESALRRWLAWGKRNNAPRTLTIDTSHLLGEDDE